MEEDVFYLKPKKSLGQHFLRSEKALMQIVDSIDSPPAKGLVSIETRGGVVFEIGPGEGVLTEKLLEKGFTVCAIEIDKRSIEILKQKFVKEILNKKLFIIGHDCLEIDYEVELKKISKEKEYSLVGNIPYYITGAIFRKTFEQTMLPKEVVFLIQKEVAQRIVANDKKESILSTSIKIFSPSVKIVDIVKKGSFTPPPKVDSAILAIQNISSPFKKEGSYEIFFTMLKAAFSQKRKLMLPNLKNKLPENLQEKYFNQIKLIVEKENGEKARAEDVSIETWKKVIRII